MNAGLVFVGFDLKTLDITRRDEHAISIRVSSKKGSGTLTIPSYQVFGVLSHILNLLEREKTTFFFSGLKEVLSYCRKHRPQFRFPEHGRYYLSDVLARLRKHEEPHDINSAVALVRNQNRRLDEWQPIYKHVLEPLCLRVLPEVENNPLLRRSMRHHVHTYYQVEGQVNGRLRNGGNFRYDYLTHTLSDKDKPDLIPPGFDQVYYLVDIVACDVTVLAHLSGDSRLIAMLEHPRYDVYQMLYGVIMNAPCKTSEERDFIKTTFLAFVYGAGVDGLAASLEVVPSALEEIHDRMRQTFHKAFSYVENGKAQAKEQGYLHDGFGRIRKFDEHEEHKARNYLVQSPAASFCLEYFVRLHEVARATNARLFGDFYDGFGFYCGEHEIKNLHRAVSLVFTEPSKLDNRIRFSIKAKYGASLHQLSAYHNAKYPQNS